MGKGIIVFGSLETIFRGNRGNWFQLLENTGHREGNNHIGKLEIFELKMNAQ